MKEQYIRQVKHHLYLPRKQKQEVLRDLEEIFASAQEHGETENQVMERLGDPKEYAHEVQKPLDQRRGGTALVGLVLSCIVCVGAVALFLSTLQTWVPQNTIGAAQGSTSIQIVGGVDISPLLLVIAALALVCGAYCGLRVYRSRHL